MKLLYVVHRYAPFPGGSEYNVQRMAEECLRQNHDVTVFASEHKGNFNGVKVTDNINIFTQKWDLIIVHGGDVPAQNFVHYNAKKIKEFGSKILYLLIKPSESQVCLHGIKEADFIGGATKEDWNHIKKWNVEHKSYYIPFGLTLKDSLGQKGAFKKTLNIPENKKLFISCGGYWPNKKMIELAKAFTEANLPDAILVTTGYDNRYNLMPEDSKSVLSFILENPKDVKNAIADADCYIMNSTEEGFGLVLLEAMLNKTPWISRNIAGAQLLSEYGTVYSTEKELIDLLKNFKTDFDKVEKAYQYVIQNHLITHTIDDILNIISKA
ncbi:MAG: hypothetical protein RLZZ337_662 [Bacteroidota bacterium]|jgi:glycosyltransferase involved in cell wall biosynthesis